MATDVSTPTRFYTEVLGAELRNPRWSWGAYDPVKARLYLRVWQDEIVVREGVSYVMVLRDAQHQKPGRQERERHLELAASGAEAFGVLCLPDGPRRNGKPRRIRNFDRDTLLRLGQVIELPSGKYAEILEEVPVKDVMRAPSGAATLRSDLLAIQRQAGLSATEREALTNARIGQGAFRNAVLRRWGGGCAVTGCRTLEAIRASHIKPWRRSTNIERLDAENGLPLIATLDALFDAGLISFADDGTVLISPRLTAQERETLALGNARLRTRPSEATASYLADHRSRYGLVATTET